MQITKTDNLVRISATMVNLVVLIRLLCLITFRSSFDFFLLIRLFLPVFLPDFLYLGPVPGRHDRDPKRSGSELSRTQQSAHHPPQKGFLMDIASTDNLGVVDFAFGLQFRSLSRRMPAGQRLSSPFHTIGDTISGTASPVAIYPQKASFAAVPLQGKKTCAMGHV